MLGRNSKIMELDSPAEAREFAIIFPCRNALREQHRRRISHVLWASFEAAARPASKSTPFGNETDRNLMSGIQTAAKELLKSTNFCITCVRLQRAAGFFFGTAAT